MQKRLTMFATAVLIGAAALAATTSAKAAHWAVVPDDDDAYVVEPAPTYVVPEERRVIIRPPAYVERSPQARSDDGYITAGIYDNCTIHREPGWFGGTYETRECH